MKKPKYTTLLILIFFVSIFFPSYAFGQPTAQPPYPYYGNYPLFEGYWQGEPVYLQNIPNVTVEQLPDAVNIGMLYDFNAIEPPYSRPPFYCLNGESINVWTAPYEFPGELIVHNGMQGPQCTYGTWIITQAVATPSPSPNELPQPINPQFYGSIGTAPAPIFVFAVGSGVNVYYDPFLSSFLYEYNGIYFNWVNDAWVYSINYDGPWYAITPYVIIPTPLLFGPPPPVVAYRPYWSWWSIKIGPFYMTYHPLWWRRYGIYATHYNLYVKKVINNYYINNNFYAVGRYRMHAVINPHQGRLIFPRDEHPVVVRGRVIFPRGVKPVRYIVPVRTRRGWLPSLVHQGHLHPHLPIAIIRHPGKIVLGAHRIIPSPASNFNPHLRAPYNLPARGPINHIRSRQPVPSRQHLPVYTTGPIMKHPTGIYRGIGVLPKKSINNRQYQKFPHRPYARPKPPHTPSIKNMYQHHPPINNKNKIKIKKRKHEHSNI